MPTLIKLNKMDRNVVYNWLVKCPISIYKGLTIEEVEEHVTKSEARKYLGKLILLNDRNKSQLTLVSELDSSLENRSGIPAQQIFQSS